MAETDAPADVGAAPNGDDVESRAVLLAAGGDVVAFELLVRRCRGSVESLLRHACRNASLAEDLTQLTFLKAWQRLDSLRDAKAFRPWLRRIALNTVVDAVRGGALDTAAHCEESREPGAESPEDAIVRRLDVDTALGHLSFGQRTCILLAYGEQMSHSEIALACDIPIGTVKSHIARGLATLRRLSYLQEGVYERS